MSFFTKRDDETSAEYLRRIGLSSNTTQNVDRGILFLEGPSIFNRNSNVAKLIKDDMRSPNRIIDDANGAIERIEWNSFSGADTNIYLMVNSHDSRPTSAEERKKKNFQPVLEIQTLSVSSARSVHPVRRLGESHVTQYTRGARTIAGTMVFATGTRDIFAAIGNRSKREMNSVQPFFTDEIPGFSILITCINEYGQASHAALTDVTLTNFGTTFSESDMYLESTYTYVARYYHPLLPDPSILNHLELRSDRGGKVLSMEYEGDSDTLKQWIYPTIRDIVPGGASSFTPSEAQAIKDWAVRNSKKGIR